MPNTPPPLPPPPSPDPAPLDPRLLDGAMEVLREFGWDGLTQERMAEHAGLSRVTAWRAGATKDAVVAALLRRLEADFRDSLWPVLTAGGRGADRLREGLGRLCDVSGRHLPLLMASDRVLHRVFRSEHGATGTDFSAPFARFIEEGLADGSVRRLGEDVDEAADVVFNAACWTFVHLCGVHGWPAERAKERVLDLVASGFATGD